MYKLLALCLKARIAARVEVELQRNQYGFRAGHSTSQAIHYIRRLQDMHERAGLPCYIILLDWEKAVDKLFRI